jgi:hypothetical protein
MRYFKGVIWVLEGLYLIWFYFASDVEQIIVGITLLSLILINNFFEPIENKQDKVFHETFYDAFKFIIFGIFSILYSTFKNINFLFGVLAFVAILYFINFLKLKSELTSLLD